MQQIAVHCVDVLFPTSLFFIYIYISYACKEREHFLSLLKSLRVIGVADQARIRVTEALVLNICGTSVDCVNVSSVPTGHLQLLWCLSPTFSSLGCWLVLLSLHVFSYLACNFLRCGKKIYMFSVYFMLDPWLTNGSSRYKAVLGQSDRHWLYLVFSFFTTALDGKLPVRLLSSEKRNPRYLWVLKASDGLPGHKQWYDVDMLDIMWRALLWESMFSPVFPPRSLPALRGVWLCVLPLTTTRLVRHLVRSTILVTTAILVESPSPRHPDYHSCGLTIWPWLAQPVIVGTKITQSIYNHTDCTPKPYPQCVSRLLFQWLWRLSCDVTVGQQGSDTVFLVVGLVSGMGGVFFAFAFMALCYRSVVVHKNFSLCLRSVRS